MWYSRLINNIRRWWIKPLSCDKDRYKVCPRKSAIEIHGAGQLHCPASAYMKCCKTKELIEQFKKIKVN